MDATLSSLLKSAPTREINRLALSSLESSVPFVAKIFLLLVFVSVCLPSGYVAGIPVKHFIYVASVFVLGVAAIRERQKVTSEFLLLVISAFVFVTFFVMVGIFRDVAWPSQVFQEATYFLTAFTIVFMFHVLVESSLLRVESFIIAVFWGNFVFVVWKVVVVLALVKGWINYDQVYYIFYKYLNYKIVSSGIAGGLVRINFIIYDFLTVIMLFAVLTYKELFARIPKIIVNAFVLLAICSISLAFSRYLLGVAFVLLAIPYLYFSRFRTKLVVLLVLGLAGYFGFEWIRPALEQRFSASKNVASDFARSSQISALLDSWSASPLFGGGFGYYAKNLIRDPLVPFSYEVQWVGFLAKFGLVGIAYLVFLCGLLAARISIPLRHWSQGAVFLSLVLFLFGGFTNQYLVSSASGVIYCLHLALAYYASRRAVVTYRSTEIVFPGRV